jgi:triphosphoribosyl-dephospho-CoA synthase
VTDSGPADGDVGTDTDQDGRVGDRDRGVGNGTSGPLAEPSERTDARGEDSASETDDGEWPTTGWRAGRSAGDPDESTAPWRPADHPRPDFSPADHAQLALLLEVTGTPKPGNVDRFRDLPDLRFEQFLVGGIGAGEGLRLAETDAPLGDAFETAVRGMSQQAAGNTQFGCLLNLVPLVRAATTADLSPAGVHRVVEATTVDDAVSFYRAFDHVDVAVADPPAEWDALDVRRGVAAEPAVRERELTLADVMRLSATNRPPDGNAREWLRGFDRSFTAAEWLLDDDGSAPDRVARAFLRLLADEADTLVWVDHGEMTARMVSARARAATDHVDVGRRKAAATIHDRAAADADAGGEGPGGGEDDNGNGKRNGDGDGSGDAETHRAAVDAAVAASGEATLLEFADDLAEEFVAEGINPGTTADVTAAATFLALERGLPL